MCAFCRSQAPASPIPMPIPSPSPSPPSSPLWPCPDHQEDQCQVIASCFTCHPPCDCAACWAAAGPSLGPQGVCRHPGCTVPALQAAAPEGPAAAQVCAGAGAGGGAIHRVCSCCKRCLLRRAQHEITHVPHKACQGLFPCMPCQSSGHACRPGSAHAWSPPCMDGFRLSHLQHECACSKLLGSNHMVALGLGVPACARMQWVIGLPSG